MRNVVWLVLSLCLACCATAPVNAGGSVALSFDDGPWVTNNRTGAILDVLSEEGVTATFCLVGDMVNTPYGRAMVRRMRAEGHELCNHTLNHVTLNRGNIARQISGGDTAIGRALGIPGYKTAILRTPGGAVRHLRNARCYDGRPLVGWGPHGDSEDYRFSGKHVLQVVTALPPDEILLMHDGHEPPERVREIIRKLKARGLTFAPASELWTHQCRSHTVSR